MPTRQLHQQRRGLPGRIGTRLGREAAQRLVLEFRTGPEILAFVNGKEIARYSQQAPDVLADRDVARQEGQRIGVARLLKASNREAVERAAMFAQGGEFAFVLYSAALAAGVAHVQLSAAQWAAWAATCLVGVLPFSALGLWLGTLVSGRGAPALINLIYLPMAFLSGLWVPLTMLPPVVMTTPSAWSSAMRNSARRS